MRIVVYMADISFGHINAITQVNKGKNYKGHWYKINADGAPWLK